jgi:mannose-1-phosphate guanylyltransferase
MAKNSRLHALILAAGYGRRLAPLTDSVPKPLLPVGGVPLLARIIEDVLALGLEQYEIVINTHHLAEQIQEFISNNYPGIGISHEPEIRGTGGAIIAAASRLGFGPLLIHNGDVYSQAKLSTFIAQAGVAKYAAAMLLRHDEKAQSYGQINRSKSGLIVDIADRPRQTWLV